MTPTRVWPAITGILLLITLGVTGCTVSHVGPLVGPRVEAGSTQICVPASTGPPVVFGDVLTNAGSDDVLITEVTGTEHGTASVEYLIDSAGPELGQLIGAIGLPATEPMGVESEIIDRANAADGAVIPAGTSASILILVTSDPEASEIGVSTVNVEYDADGRSYREEILIDYTVAVGDTC